MVSPFLSSLTACRANLLTCLGLKLLTAFWIFFAAMRSCWRRSCSWPADSGRDVETEEAADVAAGVSSGRLGGIVEGKKEFRLFCLPLGFVEAVDCCLVEEALSSSLLALLEETLADWLSRLLRRTYFPVTTDWRRLAFGLPFLVFFELSGEPSLSWKSSQLLARCQGSGELIRRTRTEIGLRDR